jgi:hypothetical protein
MKKRNVNPLDLDKETIAKLDEKQLEAIAGGASDENAEESSCSLWTNCMPSCCGTVNNP